jgi:hypothetical protein
MKTLLNTLIILAVMAAISGGFYLAFNNTTLGFEGGERGEIGEDSDRPAPPEGFTEREGGEDDEEEMGVFGILEAFGTLVKVTIVGAIAYWLQKAVQTANKKKQAAASPQV